MLDHLQPGNVVTVTRLDRLARSTRNLLDIAERIGRADAGLRSLAEPWADTMTPAGLPQWRRAFASADPLPFRLSRSRTLANLSTRARSRWRQSLGFWGCIDLPSTGPWKDA